ncbi:unnamed protein product, partial [Mesorhabditis spiculigera]
MGANLSAKKEPPIIAVCDAPVFCVKKMGTRHLLVAGGGGAAKTGVPNQIETLLITFDPKAIRFPSAGAATKVTNKLNTDPYATMTLDIAHIEHPVTGTYLIAAGHDQYCKLYETTGFEVDPEEFKNDPKHLGFKWREVGRLTTTDLQENAYLKVVKFDRSRPRGQRLATGSTDGHIRMWETKNIFDNRDPTLTHHPILDIAVNQSEVDDLEFSNDGSIIASVGEGKAILWDVNSGKKLLDLPMPAPEWEKKYKVRFVRFTPYGEGRHVFVVAYNQIQRSSKSNCYVVLWAYNRERAACRPVVIKEMPKEAIASLCVSPCGDFTGVGTMEGTVAILDTNDMKTLLFKPKTHGIFVTSLEFLDRVARDLPSESTQQNGAHPAAQPILPGPSAACRASLISLSADKTVQLHQLPFPESPSLSSALFWTALFLLLIQFFVAYFIL